jgi:tripartite-type tricarboxylate transporter receptor subunit TctC
MKPLSVLLIAMAMGGCFSTTPAAAWLYPTKPARIITANSPGGTSDIFVGAIEKLHEDISRIGNEAGLPSKAANRHRNRSAD